MQSTVNLAVLYSSYTQSWERQKTHKEPLTWTVNFEHGEIDFQIKCSFSIPRKLSKISSFIPVHIVLNLLFEIIRIRIFVYRLETWNHFNVWILRWRYSNNWFGSFSNCLKLAIRSKWILIPLAHRIKNLIWRNGDKKDFI